MDTVKTGKFISELRRERGLTQQGLGDILGVTNKTVSRWETGTYMPPIEILELLSAEFGVTINEIVAGERLGDGDFRKKAEENLRAALSEPAAFGLKDRISYFTEKWLRDRAFEIAAAVIMWLMISAVMFVFARSAFVPVSVILGVGMYCFLRNRMMIYVERKAFKGDQTGRSKRD